MTAQQREVGGVAELVVESRRVDQVGDEDDARAMRHLGSLDRCDRARRSREQLRARHLRVDGDRVVRGAGGTGATGAVGTGVDEYPRVVEGGSPDLDGRAGFDRILQRAVEPGLRLVVPIERVQAQRDHAREEGRPAQGEPHPALVQLEQGVERASHEIGHRRQRADLDLRGDGTGHQQVRRGSTREEAERGRFEVRARGFGRAGEQVDERSVAPTAPTLGRIPLVQRRVPPARSPRSARPAARVGNRMVGVNQYSAIS